MSNILPVSSCGDIRALPFPDGAAYAHRSKNWPINKNVPPEDCRKAMYSCDYSCFGSTSQQAVLAGSNLTHIAWVEYVETLR